MPIQARPAALTTAACFLVIVIFEMVRKRRLREEYAWLWMLAGAGIFVAAFMPFEALLFLAHQMGAESPPAAIFLLGFVAVTLLCLQFSVKLSLMTDQVKNLGQKVSLLELALEEAGRGEVPEADQAA